MRLAKVRVMVDDWDDLPYCQRHLLLSLRGKLAVAFFDTLSENDGELAMQLAEIEKLEEKLNVIG